MSYETDNLAEAVRRIFAGTSVIALDKTRNGWEISIRSKS